MEMLAKIRGNLLRAQTFLTAVRRFFNSRAPFLPKMPIVGSMEQMEVGMSAFSEGLLSVFRCPFSVPNDILSMDWDGNRYVVKPSGNLVEPPDIRTSWEKVGNYLRAAMTEYEHHIQQ